MAWHLSFTILSVWILVQNDVLGAPMELTGNDSAQIDQTLDNLFKPPEVDPAPDDVFQKHYRVVTIPDGACVTMNKTSSGNATFVGPCIDLLKILADAGNITYEISAYPDGKFGKIQADGRFNGMIGAVADGNYDLIVGNIAVTRDIGNFLDGIATVVNISESILYNPGLKSDKPDYVIIKNIYYFLLHSSDNSEAKAIWANIKNRMPGSIVTSEDEAVQQVLKGKYFVSDEDTVDRLVVGSNRTFAKYPTSIYPGVPVYPFAVRKGSELGLLFNTMLSWVFPDNVQAFDVWLDQLPSAFNETVPSQSEPVL